MNHSQADVVRQMLVNRGVAVPPAGNLPASAWTVSHSYTPPERDNHITVYATGSVFQGRLLRSGRRVVQPTIQVRIRALKEELGWAKGREIEDVFDRIGSLEGGLPAQQVELGEDEYAVRSVLITTSLTRIGIDETNRRVVFTVNAQLYCVKVEARQALALEQGGVLLLEQGGRLLLEA